MNLLLRRDFNSAQSKKEDYEKNWRYYRDLKNMVDTAREEGREIGRRQSTSVATEIAKRMKDYGVSNQQIQVTTGLDEEEIQQL